MRIYEFAKQENISSAKILEKLKANGFEFKNHMSVLDEKSLIFLRSSFSKSEEESKKAVISPESKKISSDKVASSSEDQNQLRSEKKQPLPVKKTHDNEIVIDKEMPLFEVARKMGKTSGDLILVLLKKGVAYNRNHVLTVETIKELAQHFDLGIAKARSLEAGISDVVDDESGVPRWPVVVVMGHVDHGKTTLLDFIRKTNVALREKGGITQHLGAYEVASSHGKIVFLDTPGHEAFVTMRKRGARVTDLAILVVAADDGVMPQTIEALKSAQDVQIPIIVAINKIDKAQDASAVESIKRQLSSYDLIAEDWGGDTVFVPISAKTGEGVDELLEMVVLQAQLMELKAYPLRSARGIILESKIEKGYGSVANAILREGTIKKGDHFVCGDTTGKVRLLFDSFGEKIEQAGPSVPIRIVGFDKLATSGDIIKVVPYVVYSKAKSLIRSKKSFNLGFAIADAKKKIINLIIKADAYGSVEVVVDSIQRLVENNKDSGSAYNVIYSGIGDVSESDIDFAVDTRAKIVVLHAKVERKASLLAKENSIDVFKHSIIYRLLEDLEKILQEDIVPVIISKKIGEASVLKVFNIKGVGVITGALVKSGSFAKNGRVVCLRNSVTCGEGSITSLQRNKTVVAEVHEGFDFAFACDAFQDWKIGDTVECFIDAPVKK